MAGTLALKWGTFKYCRNLDETASEAAKVFFALEQSMSAMTQPMTPDHIEALCKWIDCVDEPIINDWSGEDMTREQAKAYVREYRRAAP